MVWAGGERELDFTSGAGVDTAPPPPRGDPPAFTAVGCWVRPGTKSGMSFVTPVFEGHSGVLAAKSASFVSVLVSVFASVLVSVFASSPTSFDISVILAASTPGKLPKEWVSPLLTCSGIGQAALPGHLAKLFVLLAFDEELRTVEWFGLRTEGAELKLCGCGVKGMLLGFSNLFIITLG